MKTKTLTMNELARLASVSDEPEAEFRVLFEFYSLKDFFLSTISNDEISDDIAKKITEAVSRRLSGEPCQYIIGEQYFMGNRFKVSPCVLIPRSDTEIVCESAIKYIKSQNRPLKILDLCTGSGCIGISIAVAVKNCSVDCSDISNSALEIAKQNAVENKVLDRVRLIKSDMLENCGKYDVIISNPPYIPTSVINELDNKVKNFEPFSALDGGNDGLDFYRIIAQNSAEHLLDGGRIFLEIGFDQKEAVSEIFSQCGYSDIISKKDYSGNDRLISCRK